MMKPISRKCMYGFGLVFLLLNCFGGFASQAQVLPDTEVQALQQFATNYGIKDWNVHANSCRTGQGLNFTKESGSSNVNCSCTYESSTVCHIMYIGLKNLNLTGPLPEEFTNLTFLRRIELGRNYFNGTFPISWTKLPLVFVSIVGNMVGGSLPREIGNMTSLEELVITDNQFNGTIPPELGQMTQLKRFLGTGNNFVGELPEKLGDLKNLTDFRIDGTGISGTIPSFIGNWTQLDRLDMQGTSMEGPIPTTLSLLTILTQLRISDLQGPDMSFPDLQKLTKLTDLVLRNCSINDKIPDYIGDDITNIKKLDLSFNKLTGSIPSNFEGLSNLQFLYLTNNSLTGQVPSWMTDTTFKFDISYNDFTGTSTSSCQQKNLNYISSYPSNSSATWCLKQDLPCPNKASNYQFFINCGDSNLVSGSEDYETDTDPMGPSSFFYTDKWAVSTTGDFLGNEKANFIAQTKVNVTNDLYKTARLAPISLKYFGRCLRRGSYTVKLHFAEIMFVSDRANNTPGRRIFDVEIQGESVLKDFNIAEASKAINQTSIIMEYKNVTVTGSTMEIHLYWSGKGTVSYPVTGVYGPLINAISVKPNFDPSTGGGLPAGTIAGIVVASIAAVLLVLAILWKKGYLGGKDEDQELRRELELQTGYFSLRQIKVATDNFNSANKIGEGGFGPVFKGVLPDGTVIAVKQLSAKSKQGNREFVNEIGMISALQHQHLVKLYGCCIEGNQLLLIYEYLENNSLARALFGREDQKLNLDWPTRRKICIGIARGLAYLHEESRLKIVHRDIKATNVLLDKNLKAKISDFGLAKLAEEENTHISTRIAGTIGYMAPEYAMRGYLTDKADVYSFGIVALEIVSGKSNTNYRPKEDFVYLLDWAYVLQEQGNLLDLVDPGLGTRYSKDEALKMLNLGLLCANPSPTLRPSMSAVVSMLEGKTAIQAPLVKRGSTTEEMRFKAFEKLSQDSQTQMSTMSQDSHQSMDGPWVGSSVSLPDKEESTETSSTKKLLSE